MKVVIVGGTGNISESIVRVLLEQGHDVACFNRGQHGTLPDGVRQITGDRKDRAAFESAMQREKFDAAIDMICFDKEDALSSIRAFRGVGHFVQCSTVNTYGIDYDYLPVTEDHPLRPISDYGRGKVAADAAYLGAWYDEQFPVTIIKPSTTYGPQIGLLRQVAWDYSWLDRIKKGKPVAVCGDGHVIHGFLHIDDAALGFAGVLGKQHCLGQTYNLVNRGYYTWADHHRVAMQMLGREVELVGVPLQTIVAHKVPGSDICRDSFAYNLYYSAERLFRDVPEYQPRISLLEGMQRVYAAMEEAGTIPNSDDIEWEDRLIAAQLRTRRMA